MAVFRSVIAHPLVLIAVMLAAISDVHAAADNVISNPYFALPPGVSANENSLVLAAGAMAYVTDYCPGIEGRFEVLQARAQELRVDLVALLSPRTTVERIVALTKIYGSGRNPAVCYRIYELYGPKGELIPGMIVRK